MSESDDAQGGSAPRAPFPDYLSPSQISGLMSCSWRFKLERLDKVPSRPGWGAIGGSTVHKITEIRDLEAWRNGRA